MRSMRRRLMRDKYERLNYIQFTQNLYIDTAYIPNTKTQIQTKFNLSSVGDNAQYVFGGGERVFECFTWNQFPKGNYMGSDPSFSFTTEANKDIELSANKEKWTYLIDGTEMSKTFTFTPTTTSKTIYLNRLNRSSAWTPKVGVYKLYYFRIYESDDYELGTLLHNFIPVRRRSDGKVGLLDRVENKFYTSPNGAEFVGG